MERASAALKHQGGAVRVWPPNNKEMPGEIRAGRFVESLYRLRHSDSYGDAGIRQQDIPMLRTTSWLLWRRNTARPNAFARNRRADAAIRVAGNVRELRNVFERLIIMVGAKLINRPGFLGSSAATAA